MLSARSHPTRGSCVSLARIKHPIRSPSAPGMHQRLLKTFISIRSLVASLLQQAVGAELARGCWESHCHSPEPPAGSTEPAFPSQPPQGFVRSLWARCYQSIARDSTKGIWELRIHTDNAEPRRSGHELNMRYHLHKDGWPAGRAGFIAGWAPFCPQRLPNTRLQTPPLPLSVVSILPAQLIDAQQISASTGQRGSTVL